MTARRPLVTGAAAMTATLSELADAIERTLVAASNAAGSLRLVPVT